MLVKDFITKEFPVLKSFDTGEYALALMDDFKLKHLPLLNENVYRCLVSEKDLLAMPDPTATIGDPVLFSPSVREDTHIHEALALAARYPLSQANNAHVLSLLSYTDKTTGRLHLIIKIDLEDVSPVIRSFERFNYTVLYYFMEKGMVDDLLQQRMEELVYYMNI